MNRQQVQKIKKQYQECRLCFEAFGDKVRQAIVLALVDAGFNGMNVLDITSQMKISRPAVSHHLKILKDANLITVHKKGTSNYYYLDVDERVKKIQSFLSSITALIESPEFKEEKAQKMPK